VLIGGVVGPRRMDGLVAGSPEQSLDRVRKADVDRASSVRVEVLDWCSLNLLDENVTGSASHLLTFIVGDDGVVGPNVNVRHDLVGIRVGKVRRCNRASSPDASVVGINSHQFRQVAECKVDTHFVVWQSSSRESDTRVTRVEERQWQIERGCGQNLITSGIHVDGAFTNLSGRWAANSAWVGKTVNVANHVVVTVTLAGWDGEGRPEIEVKVVETSSNEVVKGDGAFRDKVVHQIASPTENVVAVSGWRFCVQSGGGNSVHGKTKPCVEEVITCT